MTSEGVQKLVSCRNWCRFSFGEECQPDGRLVRPKIRWGNARVGSSPYFGNHPRMPESPVGAPPSSIPRQSSDRRTYTTKTRPRSSPTNVFRTIHPASRQHAAQFLRHLPHGAPEPIAPANRPEAPTADSQSTVFGAQIPDHTGRRKHYIGKTPTQPTHDDGSIAPARRCCSSRIVPREK